MELLDTIEIARTTISTTCASRCSTSIVPTWIFAAIAELLAAGILRPGDRVMALPSRKSSRVKSIVTFDGELAEAFPPQAITVTLKTKSTSAAAICWSRPTKLPLLHTRFNAYIVWMNDGPLVPGKPYYLKQTTKTVTGSISQIDFRIDVNTLDTPPGHLKLNEIGLCEVALNAPLAFDPYTRCKGPGHSSSSTASPTGRSARE